MADSRTCSTFGLEEGKVVSANKVRGFSPQANYTYRATTAFADKGCRVVSATDPHGR
jgi:hypothetical protein